MKLNEIVIGGKKPEEEKSAVDQIKRLYESRKKVTEVFASKAKYKAKQGKGIKILSP